MGELMKYSADELVTFLIEENLQGDLLTAIMNSSEQYGVLAVTGKVEKTDNWYQFVFDKIGIDLEPFEMSNTSEEVAQKMMKNPQHVSACVVLCKDVAQVIIDYCEGPAEIKQLSLWSMVFKDLFTQLGIDTKGKLKKFIENGMNKQAKANENSQKFVQLFGGANIEI